MSSGLLDIMKRTAMDAMDANQMTDLRYGKVTSIKPLKIEVTNQFTIPEALIVVPQHLTDYEIEITTAGYDWLDNGGDEMTQSKRKLKVHGALKVGDRVAVIRKQGGQSYYILDRLP